MDQTGLQTSTPVKFIATISASNYKAFGLTITKQITPITLSQLQIPRAKIALQGISAIHCLGISCKDLIPVTLQMHAAKNAKIAILSIAILQFSGQSNSGKTLMTSQLVYIMDSTNKTCVGREACTDLGLISNQFPAISEALQHLGENAISNTHLA